MAFNDRQVAASIPELLPDPFRDTNFETILTLYFQFMELVKLDIEPLSSNVITLTSDDIIVGGTTGATADVNTVCANSSVIFISPTSTTELTVGETFTADTAGEYSILSYSRMPNYALSKVFDLTGISTTDDTVYSEIWRNLLAVNLDNNPEINERQLIAKVKDIYSTKGTEEAVQFILGVYFGTRNVRVTYPSDQTMRLSAGEWKQPTFMYFNNIQGGDLSSVIGLSIRGLTSGAQSTILSAYRQLVAGAEYNVIEVTDVLGTFVVGETVETFSSNFIQQQEGNVPVITATLGGAISKIFVESAGFGYVASERRGAVRSFGDEVIITGDGATAVGEVTKIGDSSLNDDSFTVVDGGIGHQIGDEVRIISRDAISGGASGEVGTVINPYETEVFIGPTIFNYAADLISTFAPSNIGLGGILNRYASLTTSGDLVGIAPIETSTLDANGLVILNDVFVPTNPAVTSSFDVVSQNVISGVCIGIYGTDQVFPQSLDVDIPNWDNSTFEVINFVEDGFAVGISFLRVSTGNINDFTDLSTVAAGTLIDSIRRIAGTITAVDDFRYTIDLRNNERPLEIGTVFFSSATSTTEITITNVLSRAGTVWVIDLDVNTVALDDVLFFPVQSDSLFVSLDSTTQITVDNFVNPFDTYLPTDEIQIGNNVYEITFANRNQANTIPLIVTDTANTGTRADGSIVVTNNDYFSVPLATDTANVVAIIPVGAVYTSALVRYDDTAERLAVNDKIGTLIVSSTSEQSKLFRVVSSIGDVTSDFYRIRDLYTPEIQEFGEIGSIATTSSGLNYNLATLPRASIVSETRHSRRWFYAVVTPVGSSVPVIEFDNFAFAVTDTVDIVLRAENDEGYFLFEIEPEDGTVLPGDGTDDVGEAPEFMTFSVALLSPGGRTLVFAERPGFDLSTLDNTEITITQVSGPINNFVFNRNTPVGSPNHNSLTGNATYRLGSGTGGGSFLGTPSGSRYYALPAHQSGDTINFGGASATNSFTSFQYSMGFTPEDTRGLPMPAISPDGGANTYTIDAVEQLLLTTDSVLTAAEGGTAVGQTSLSSGLLWRVEFRPNSTQLRIMIPGRRIFNNLENVVITANNGTTSVDIVSTELTTRVGEGAYVTIDSLAQDGIEEVTIVNPGLNYTTIDSSNITVNSATGVGARLNAELSAAISNPPTQVTDGYVNKNHLISHSSKLQDNIFYQDFSYQISADISLDSYQEFIERLIHPAGMRLFGEFILETIISNQLFARGAEDINESRPDGTPKYKDTIILFDIPENTLEITLSANNDFTITDGTNVSPTKTWSNSNSALQPIVPYLLSNTVSGDVDVSIYRKPATDTYAIRNVIDTDGGILTANGQPTLETIVSTKYFITGNFALTQ